LDRIALLADPSASASVDVFSPENNDISLTQMSHQQWDDQGKAVGYSPDPKVIAMPQPRLQQRSFSFHAGDEEQGNPDSEADTDTMYPPGLSTHSK
jgi:hypothetical protein